MQRRTPNHIRAGTGARTAAGTALAVERTSAAAAAISRPSAARNKARIQGKPVVGTSPPGRAIPLDDGAPSAENHSAQVIRIDET